MTEIRHKKCSWRYTACSHTVTRTLWDHLPRISMTRFICKKPFWILMRNYNPKETFIIYFLSSFYGPPAHLPLARKLGINIQFQCTLIFKVITAAPLFINDEDSTRLRKCTTYFEYRFQRQHLFTNFLLCCLFSSSFCHNTMLLLISNLWKWAFACIFFTRSGILLTIFTCVSVKNEAFCREWGNTEMPCLMLWT